jgi:hypothetical protein
MEGAWQWTEAEVPFAGFSSYLPTPRQITQQQPLPPSLSVFLLSVQMRTYSVGLQDNFQIIAHFAGTDDGARIIAHFVGT